MTDTILSKVVRYIHYAFMLVLVFGVFLPGKYLIYFLFLLPAIYIHWYFNDNRCMLTELESYFDQKHVNLNNDDEVYHYKYINVLEMLKKINIYFDSADSFTSYLYNIFFICWVVGFIRFLNYYKKDIFNTWSVIKKPLQRRFLTDK
jgi:hypothetical protein